MGIREHVHGFQTVDGFRPGMTVLTERSGGKIPWLRRARWCGVALFMGWVGTTFGQSGTPVVQAPAGTAVDPAMLMRRAVQHRLESDRLDRTMRYVLRRTDGRRETTKEIVETKDGDVARLIAIDGRALNAEEERSEMERLEELAAHPELQEHRLKEEQRDRERIDHGLSLLPEAEIYQMEGIVSCGTAECYRLSFTPNPKFEAPDMESDILRGVAGEVWIDTEQERMVRMDAHFIADVDFGFGILGKLDKGGTILLEQRDVGGHVWELTGMKVNFAGKALMVKSIHVQMEEEASEFSPVPQGLGYKDAIEMLKKPVGEILKKP